MATRVHLNRDYDQQKELEKRLDLSTAALGLSVRTTNCLDEEGICTIGDLLACKREDLLTIDNIGEKTLEDVYLALERLGFYRNDRPQDSGTRLAKSA